MVDVVLKWLRSLPLQNDVDQLCVTDSVEEALAFLTSAIEDWEQSEIAAGRPPHRVSSNGTSSPFIAPMKDRSPVAFAKAKHAAKGDRFFSSDDGGNTGSVQMGKASGGVGMLGKAAQSKAADMTLTGLSRDSSKNELDNSNANNDGEINKTASSGTGSAANGSGAAPPVKINPPQKQVQVTGNAQFDESIV